MLRLKIILKLFFLLLVLYFLLRLIFGIIYFSSSDFDATEVLKMVYWGLRLDYTALFYVNIPFLLVFFFIIPFLPRLWQIKWSVCCFSFINLPFIALDVIDLVYFRYTLRRSTVDVFYSLPASIHSFGTLFRQYWFVLLTFSGLCFLLIWMAMRILKGVYSAGRGKPFARWFAPLLFIVLSFFIARGRNNRPITPSTPLLYFDPVVQPLVNNSTLNFLYSYKRFNSKLDRKDYFSATELDSIFTIRRQYDHDSSINKRNIVIFLMESFAEQYFDSTHNIAYTPFLDSLRNKSLVCTSAFQNGQESVKGLLSVLASIPPFLEQPMFTSNYNSVPFNGIGTLLKNEGYTTNFFLGAEYDHFNFAKLCRMTGIDHYYSKADYDHQDKDDGNWGIYDEYFFPYFADISSQMQEPFFSALFNISSHPPFAIPKPRQKQFALPGLDNQLRGIAYVDYCFSQLFERIRDQSWFRNTLFVFVADHTLLDDHQKRSLLYESQHIPLFIYDPQRPVFSEISRPVQQLDIVPAILDMIGYSRPFMSFGNSFLRSGGGYSISKVFGAYQLIDSSSITGFDEHSGAVMYSYDRLHDRELIRNMVADSAGISRSSGLIKAILQRFNNSILDRHLLIKE